MEWKSFSYIIRLYEEIYWLFMIESYFSPQRCLPPKIPKIDWSIIGNIRYFTVIIKGEVALRKGEERIRQIMQKCISLMSWLPMPPPWWDRLFSPLFPWKHIRPKKKYIRKSGPGIIQKVWPAHGMKNGFLPHCLHLPCQKCSMPCPWKSIPPIGF